jgi:hypothetical protein
VFDLVEHPINRRLERRKAGWIFQNTDREAGASFKAVSGNLDRRYAVEPLAQFLTYLPPKIRFISDCGESDL